MRDVYHERTAQQEEGGALQPQILKMLHTVEAVVQERVHVEGKPRRQLHHVVSSWESPLTPTAAGRATRDRSAVERPPGWERGNLRGDSSTFQSRAAATCVRSSPLSEHTFFWTHCRSVARSVGGDACESRRNTTGRRITACSSLRRDSVRFSSSFWRLSSNHSCRERLPARAASASRTSA